MMLAECNYKMYDRELLAIVKGFKKFYHYLKGAAHIVQVLSGALRLQQPSRVYRHQTVE